VRKCGRAKRRFSKRTAVHEQLSLLSHFELIPAGYLHEEIMGMLAINDRQAVSRFSGLEKLRISPLGHGEWVHTQHRPEGNRIPSVLTHKHRHYPIYRIEFVAASRTTLLGI